MPNRILKESICTSEDIDALDWFEEVFYYRLLVSCDDYGRMDGRIRILQAKLFPLRQEVGEDAMARALDRLCGLGCVRRYAVQGRPYLALPAWDDHQKLRTRRAKYPPPPEGEAGTGDAPADGSAEARLCALAEGEGVLFGHAVRGVRRQARVGSVYLDMVAETDAGLLVAEVTGGRLTDAVAARAARNAKAVGGFAVLVGGSVDVRFDWDSCEAADVAVAVWAGGEDAPRVLRGSSRIAAADAEASGDGDAGCCADEGERRADVGGRLAAGETESKGTGIQDESESESEEEGEEGWVAAVAAAAASVGMMFAERDREIAGGLVRAFTAEWVVAAIERSADGPSRTWRYVRGILGKWKELGGMDEAGAGGSAAKGAGGRRYPAQEYTQRVYEAAELAHLIEKI